METPIIEVRHMCKTWGDHCVLNDVNLSVMKGDVFGILGLSGAGKSTLVRCINGLETPTVGDVCYGGTIISAPDVKTPREVRRKVAMIFQSFNLLQQRTALGNVEFASEVNHIKDDSQAIKMLDLVGLKDKVS